MTRSLSAIFCDDVRQEVGNKLSYMGCYTGQMFVQTLPIVLPKLCVVMSVKTSPSNPFKKLTFRLTQDDETIAEADINIAELVVPPAPPPRSSKDDLMMSLFQVFQVVPCQILEPCVFRARAYTEKEELRGGTLAVSLQQPQAEK